MPNKVTVTSSRYNELRQRIQAIMGNATDAFPTTGYGQLISSQSVTGVLNQPDLTAVNKISAQDYEDLYLDLARARIHQIGTEAFFQTPFPIGNFLVNPNANKIELDYIQALETLMTDIENDKDLFDIATQGSIENLKASDGENIQSVRTASWGGASQTQVVNHRFRVRFLDESHRRHFFNTGGQVRFQAGLAYSGSEDKTISWRNLLNNMGIIIFDANKTVSSTNAGAGSARGNYQLTSTFTEIYSKSSTSAVYSTNSYRILARNVSPTVIVFNIQFRDDYVGSGPPDFRTDESVLGTLTSGPIQIATASGSATINGITTDTVVIDPPLGNTTSTL